MDILLVTPEEFLQLIRQDVFKHAVFAIVGVDEVEDAFGVARPCGKGSQREVGFAAADVGLDDVDFSRVEEVLVCDEL